MPIPLRANDDSFLWSSEEVELRPVSVFATAHPYQLEEGGVTEISVTGRLKAGRYIYSIENQGAYTPIPTSINVDHPLFLKIGDGTESKTTHVKDEVFDRVLKVHQKEFQIKQKYKVGKFMRRGEYIIPGYMYYQQCSNKICSLPTKSFFEVSVTISE